MPTIGSVTKTIRINPSDLAVIERLMADGTSWSGAVHKLCEGVPESGGGIPYEIDKADLDDLSTMAVFMGGSVKAMIHLFDVAVNEGVFTYENGKYVGVPEIDLTGFYEACHDLGLNPQEALNKMVQSMRRTTK